MKKLIIVMRRTAGSLIVFLFATLSFIANAAGDETSISHVAHLSAAYGHGPQLACGACHSVPYAGRFLDNQDLANTTVCNTCHSPGGTYDGVGSVDYDVNPDDGSVGAKGNWVTGVYSNGELAAGKEKWCVGCHDDAPAVVNGVSAPNIAGSVTNSPYDYGYYITGHGKHGLQKAITCLTCHDASRVHVDGLAKTYTAAAKNYQAGYRLKLVNGKPPLAVPRTTSGGMTDKFLLCFSCHDSTPFLTKDNPDTNFRADVNDSCVGTPAAGLVNKHWYHLQASNAFNRWDSDWDGAADSLISCTACHNVHGPRLKNVQGISHAPAMIRTGEEMGRPSSLNLDYLVNSCPDWNNHSPTNELSGSSGGVMKFQGPYRGSIQKNHVCIECHNEYQPYFRAAKKILSCEKCHTSGSHVTHLAAAYGPYVSCDACHDLNSIPFVNGGKIFSDGKNLAETHVCDTCHSPGGSYDGITDPVVGAKPNWANRVYSGSNLQPGKDKWCATCHDEQPSVIAGVAAPNVIGDEDAATSYGLGYGYYKTGHGLAQGTYPASGGPAANKGCPDCHNPSTAHIDGEARTYTAAAHNYQAGYRLWMPMNIPRSGQNSNDFGLCFSCHPSAPYVVQNDMTTNFRDDTISVQHPNPVNAHWRHLMDAPRPGTWDSDWDRTGDSLMSCPACHNVHGSPSPRMVRHGELISTPGTTDKVRSLNFKYTPAANYPDLPHSTGGVTRFIGPGPGTIAKNGICIMCHNDSISYTRTPLPTPIQ